MTIRVDVDAHSSKQAPAGGVFFTQHIPEIVRMELWAGSSPLHGGTRWLR
jgi:hypothetical protein